MKSAKSAHNVYGGKYVVSVRDVSARPAQRRPAKNLVALLDSCFHSKFSELPPRIRAVISDASLLLVGRNPFLDSGDQRCLWDTLGPKQRRRAIEDIDASFSPDSTAEKVGDAAFRTAFELTAANIVRERKLVQEHEMREDRLEQEASVLEQELGEARALAAARLLRWQSAGGKRTAEHKRVANAPRNKRIRLRYRELLNDGESHSGAIQFLKDEFPEISSARQFARIIKEQQLKG